MKKMKKCSKCKIVLTLDNFNKDSSTKSDLQNKCKGCKNYYYELYKDRLKKEYNENKDIKLLYQNEYYKLNKKDRIAYQVKYINNRIKTDKHFRLKLLLRNRINSAFKNKKYYKEGTRVLLGEKLQIVKKFIEDKFTEGMTWDNHGEWHIDHIKPLASANNRDELISLCHYTNLQPLWAIDNLKKGSKF